ncbi:peptide chain release factor N(5)-glutamine methyltransferase [Aquisalimonas sp. 2447]|uniref:peptide chain release factor N(5)-glutamine methyltransferase n=1 Tax=Aquisalimonas sp. 2447 TaxID=2740807 RepID=UPI00143239F4|nr:peptide chain release factor N(5)-glutamine methyltransferase [Aquisalimonas sp. 2447]QIT56437.1 peptide chain release factor N(5)-glutamine methyltransferase [Aquisalimonas sp. 2447]
MTFGELLQEGRAQLPHREAHWLLEHAAGLSAAALRARTDQSVDDTVTTGFRDLIRRRASGVPLAHLVGTQPFRHLELIVDASVLIPRAETEELVTHALELMPADTRCSALDLGTGSGAIALALAADRPHWSITAVERSTPALTVARANGERLGLQVEWLTGDWFQPVDGRRFDLIVSNPPYVNNDDPELAPEVAAHEPAEALLAGPDGLDAIRTVTAEAPGYLIDGGWLIVEHGYRQAEAVRGLMSSAGLARITSFRDHAGRDRFTAARR